MKILRKRDMDRNEKKSAGRYFNGKEKHNCAQAIGKAFQSEFGISEEVIKTYKRKGKGKAEGGICGSLFAARQILKNPEDVSRLEKLFVEKAGSIKCKEIKKHKIVDCEGTVILTEKFIKTLLDKSYND